MSLFAIADLHLSFGTDKPMDVFKGWHNYTDRLYGNWNNTVSEGDTVVISGDVSWAMKLEDTVADFTFIHNLPGKKIIIKGNHDYWWTTKHKMDCFLADKGFDSISILHNCAFEADGAAICGTRGWFYDAESDVDKKILMREVGRLNTSISFAKQKGLEPIVFLHYPPLFGDAECREIIEVLVSNNIKKCFYGHIHGNKASKKAFVGVKYGIEFNLIACDYLDFTPLKLI